MFGTWIRRSGPYAGGWLADMERLRGEMERWFGRRTRALEYPPLNLWANADGAVLTAEVPGVRPEEVDISVSGGLLTLRVTRNAAPENAGAPHRQERPAGTFVRTVELPFQVDAGQVAARCVNGLLEVRLPRAEVDKPRKIAIQSA